MSVDEFQVLKASHRFLRADGQAPASWEDQVADKYESSLFREFAVCDLKHYKSGQFALRWRTEDEVVSGAGQETCGNTRCEHHSPERARSQPALTTLELPFNYAERGEQHSALVKVVLCDRCVHKLMWKRNQAKKERLQAQGTADEQSAPLNVVRSSRERSLRREKSPKRRSASPRRKRDGESRRKRSRSRERHRDESLKKKSSGHHHAAG